MTKVIFRAENLHKSYGALVVSKDISLNLEHSKLHALIGPNGAGKTTALAQLSGELSSDSGKVFFEDKDITHLDMPERARRGIARSFQITSLLHDYSVLDNVMTAVQAKAAHSFKFWKDARKISSLREEAEAYLERVGLLDIALTPVTSLAHGQKKQLEMAMALSTKPQVLLLDEPMAGLGVSETEAMTELIRSLRPNHAILLVEHDMDVVFQLADTVSVLVYGELIATGSPEEVRVNEKVQQAYLDEDDY